MKCDSLRTGAVLALIIASIGFAGCTSSGSLLQRDTIDYSSAKLRPTLEVPPDLTRLSTNDDYQVPGVAVSFSEYSVSSTQTQSTGISNTVGDVTMRREGDKRWLFVERSPEKIWSTLEDFWQDIGFMLVLDEPKLGIMETDWAENRAKIPQDFIRRAIGSIFDGLYSTGERDKFRTRVEITAEGTEIFITHRGVEEVYTRADESGVMWQPKPSDPELEAEMLRRLMVRLGATAEQSHRAVAQEPNVSGRTQVITVGGNPALELNEEYSSAWRWVGISLDRTSFTVVSSDNSTGIYNVRYIDPVADTQANERGLLSGLFGGKKDQNVSHDYQIKLSASEQSSQYTIVQVLSAEGQAIDQKVSTRIINALAKDLK